MRLYYYGIDNNLGGLENYAKTLLGGIKQLDPTIDITIITEYEDIAYKDFFLSLGIDIEVIPHKRKLFEYYKALKSILMNHQKDDVFQINAMSYRNSLLFKAAKKSKIRTIVVGHGLSMEAGLFSKLLHSVNRYSYRKLGTKIAISDDVIPYMFTSKSNVIVIKNIIDFSKYKYKEEYRKSIRNKLGINDNDFLIGQIGRLCSHKNQTFSLSIVQNLVKDYSNIKMLFIGKNLDQAIASEILKTRNENIMYLNQLENVNEYYSALDLVLFPSRSEGAGLTALEAIKNGCPLIISDNVPYIEANNYISLPLEEELWEKEIIKIYKGESTIKRAPTPRLPDYGFFDSYLNLYKNNNRRIINS